MNIALRLGLYEKTDDFLEFIFPIADTKSSVEYKLLDIDPKNTSSSKCCRSIMGLRGRLFERELLVFEIEEYVKYRYFGPTQHFLMQFKRLFLSDALEI